MGCDNSTAPADSGNLPLLGKWQVIEESNWDFLSVDDYIEITDDKYIKGSEVISVDEFNMPIDTCFNDMIFDYIDNNPNLILSTYYFGETPQPQATFDIHITYQLSNIQLNLQYLFNIINGDTTHLVDSYAIAIPVSEMPEDDCPF